MIGFRNFIIQFLIVFIPTVFSGMIILNYAAMSKLEIALSAFLIAATPWLLLELLQRHTHQKKSNQALLRFCSSLDQVFSSVNTIEKQSAEHPKEMIAELKMLQGILKQIAIERGDETIKENLGAPQGQVIPNDITENNGNTAEYIRDKTPPLVEVSPPDIHEVKENEETERTIPLTRKQLLLIIEEALNSDKIEMLVQPIVSLPQRKARHFECFSRIKTTDGTIYTPDHFVHLAEEENLIRLVDNAMLFRCIQMARSSVKKKFNVNFFCNVSCHTLSDKFFFESLIEFFQSNRELGRNIILEFHETAIFEKLNELEPFFRKLKLYNCRFSVDQVTRFDIDISRLRKLNFKYVKFHSDAIAESIKTDEGIQKVREFKKICNIENIDVILSHVEDEKALLDFNDFHFDYGQGYLFGSPVISKN